MATWLNWRRWNRASTTSSIDDFEAAAFAAKAHPDIDNTSVLAKVNCMVKTTIAYGLY
jgi:hypothetical protein